MAPAIGGREEVPVAYGVARDAIGDVIGGQGKGIDAGQDFPRLQGSCVHRDDPALGQIVPADL